MEANSNQNFGVGYTYNLNIYYVTKKRMMMRFSENQGLTPWSKTTPDWPLTI